MASASIVVTSLKGGHQRYRVRFRLPSGAAVGESTRTFGTRAEAEAFRDDIHQVGPAVALTRLNRIRLDTPEYSPTVREWFDVHMRGLTGVKDGTRRTYRQLADRTFLPLIGGLRLDELDRMVIADVVNALQKQPVARGQGTLSPRTITQAHTLLASVLRTATLQGKIPLNPATGVRLPKVPRATAHARFLSHEEWERLHAAMNLHYKDFILFLVATGLRWSEATALEARSVNLSAGSVRVERSWERQPGKRVIGTPKTTKSYRTIWIPEQAVEAVGRVIYSREPTDLLWQRPSGGVIYPQTFHPREWKPAREAAGLPHLRVHDLRHTCASWYLEAGATLEQLQDHLGHESILTTREVYGHLQPSMHQAMRGIGTRMLEPRPVTVAGEVVR